MSLHQKPEFATVDGHALSWFEAEFEWEFGAELRSEYEEELKVG